MYAGIAASLVSIFFLLCITEYLWRKNIVVVETSRKIIHIGTGIIIAFWPYYVEWPIITGLSIAMLAVISISYTCNIFGSIHSVQRITKGEILYPVSVGLCSLFQPEPWIFALAILHLALADGMAALIGLKYGKRTAYTKLSRGKSVAGSAAFFVTSFVLLMLGALLLPGADIDYMPIIFACIALGLTVLESLSWYGLDDITVPLGVVAVLSLLA
jgi:phytol kinase